MARHVHARLRLVAACAVLAAGLSPLLPSVAVADTAQETVVPAAMRATYTSGALYGGSSYNGHDGAGAQGVFHSLEGSGLVWTRYADGISTKVVHPEGYTSYNTAGGDVLAYRYADGRVDLWNAADGTTRTIRTPEGLTYMTAYGDLAVAYRQWKDDSGTNHRDIHLLFPDADGTTRDVPVTGVPEGYILATPKGGDADRLLFYALHGEKYLSVMVDRHTGQVQQWTPTRDEIRPRAQVTADHVVLFSVSDPVVEVYSRADLSAAPVEVTLPGGGTNPTQDLAVVGDWLITRPGTAVIATPLAGGPSKTLLPASNPAVAAGTDGSALAVGRTAAAEDDWGVQRIQEGPDGNPVVTQVKALPKPTYRIQGLSLNQGRLVVADDRNSTLRANFVRTVAPSGTPTFGESSPFLHPSARIDPCPAGDTGCSGLHGLGDGQIAWINRNTADGATMDALRMSGEDLFDGDTVTVPAGGRIADASGEYVLYSTATEQYVYRPSGTGTPVVTRPAGAAALSGNVLWTAGTTTGSVVPYDLTTQKTGTPVTTDAGCTPTELQALGRWLYWNCGDTAGVYDRTAGRSVPVPADEAELGDGFVVTHDKSAGKLVLTTVADGTPRERVVGDLPDTGVSQRDVRWSIDESGPNLAYVDAKERVHLVPSGVPQGPLRLLQPAETADEVYRDEEYPDVHPLTAVLLSKPARSWKLTVRDKASGKVVDVRSGGAVRGSLRIPWQGVTAADVELPNGVYDWTLSVVPADGVGTPLEVKHTTRLLHAGAAPHDYLGGPDPLSPDGVGDLLTLTSSGALTFHQGTRQGTFSGKLTGSGWSTGVRPVAFGDLSGDRCNDVLIRLSSGSLRLYKPGCNKALKPSTPYTTLGTSGWNQYDVLASVGDVTKDGSPDLLARNAKTGTVYLYEGRTTLGKLSGRTARYADWKTYKKIVGAGDLNGDGIGDLVTQDKSNNLFRYYGKGNGTFSARVKLFSTWGASYNAVVGVGDITGDGKPDLVARDTAGVLYRLPGNGKGSFGSRVKISTGWQGYQGIF
ncbi:VCBS repeat-containing protein [Streptomyces sp. NPDC005820]|uniref:FG-GAP repeat domain-containing protein n=1 Tax=Streptomyces sp. NPDC005820 TaxID=3157069 RepID=UPI0033EE9DBC